MQARGARTRLTFKVMVPARDRLPQRDCMARTIRRGCWRPLKRGRLASRTSVNTARARSRYQRCSSALTRSGSGSPGRVSDQSWPRVSLTLAESPRRQLQPILPAEIEMRFPVDVLPCRRAGAVALEIGQLPADPCSTFLHPLRNQCLGAIDGRAYQHAAVGVHLDGQGLPRRQKPNLVADRVGAEGRSCRIVFTLPSGGGRAASFSR